jgi:hypothetical protein
MMSWGALFFSDTTMGGEPITVSIAPICVLRCAQRRVSGVGAIIPGGVACLAPVPGTRAWHR